MEQRWTWTGTNAGGTGLRVAATNLSPTHVIRAHAGRVVSESSALLLAGVGKEPARALGHHVSVWLLDAREKGIKTLV